MAFCSQCGAQVVAEAAFCLACGKTVLASAIKQPTPISTQADSILENEASKIFVGKNYDYFLRKWEIAEQKKSKTSWNWAAFVFGGAWMAYRKMYIYSWIFLGVMVLEILCEYAFGFPEKFSNIINISIAVTFGLQGNSLYKQHVEKKTREIIAMNTPDQAQNELVRQGGTNIGATIGFIVALIAIAMLLAVTFPP